ncbi:MAG: methyltransferase domain-containing protein [Rikenella sp.]|nr:methyltransferase domain-containing protein [Rikenella sp.]
MKHDKHLLQRRFSRRLESYDTLATVQRAIADRLADRLAQAVSSRAAIRHGVEIGAGTGFLTRHLVRLFPEAAWIVNDLVAESRDYLPKKQTVRFEAGDGERFDFAASEHGGCDLIASASVVQWFDDLPGFIARAAAGLRESGGLLAFSTFGPENFREITATTGQGLDYYPLTELIEFCRRAGLEPTVAEEWIERPLYPTPTDVLRHLRLTGVNAVAAERWTHNRLRQFEADYRAAYTAPAVETADRDVTLTFHPILVLAEKR